MTYHHNMRYVIYETSAIPRNISEEFNLLRLESLNYCKKLSEKEEENNELKKKILDQAALISILKDTIRDYTFKKYNKKVEQNDKEHTEGTLNINHKIEQQDKLIGSLMNLIETIKKEFTECKQLLTDKYVTITNVLQETIKENNIILSSIERNHKREMVNITQPLYDSLHDIRLEYNNLKKVVKKMSIYKTKLELNEKEVTELKIKNKEYLDNILFMKIKSRDDEIAKRKYISVIIQLQQNEKLYKLQLKT